MAATRGSTSVRKWLQPATLGRVRVRVRARARVRIRVRVRVRIRVRFRVRVSHPATFGSTDATPTCAS